MKTATDYEKEFDKEVEKYTQWLYQHSNSIEKAKKSVRERKGSFAQNFAGALYSAIEAIEIPLLIAIHPIGSREDLTQDQKEAIALASDVGRVPGKIRQSLEARCLPKEKAEESEEIIRVLLVPFYEYHKSVYVAQAMRKT